MEGSQMMLGWQHHQEFISEHFRWDLQFFPWVRFLDLLSRFTVKKVGVADAAVAVFSSFRGWALSKETKMGPRYSEMTSWNPGMFKNLFPSELRAQILDRARRVSL